MAGWPSHVLLVSHDAALAGAPICVRELAHVLRHELGRVVELAVCGDGDLLDSLAALGPLTRLHDSPAGIRRAAGDCFRDFRRRAPAGLILVNTAAVPEVFAALDDQGLRDAVAWIHELPETIETSHGGAATIELVRRVCQRIVVPADFVRQAFVERYGVAGGEIVRATNGIPRPVARAAAAAAARDAPAAESLRALLDLPAPAVVVLGSGMPERRKGLDLFAEVAAGACELAPDLPLHFVWLGKQIERAVRDEARQRMAVAGHAGRLHLRGQTPDPQLYYAAADLLLITSRLDASPLINAEAMAFGLPVLFFAGRSGAGELHPSGLDLAVPAFDTAAMAARAVALLRDTAGRQRLGALLRAHAGETLSWSRFAASLGAWLDVREHVPMQVVAEAASAAVAPLATRGGDPPLVVPTADRLVAAQALAGQVAARQARDGAAPAAEPVLVILPDVEVGGGQLNAIRLANALTATHRVFVLNARPTLFDEAVARSISPGVVALEGTLRPAPWYDEHAAAAEGGPNHLDEREHRLRVVAALMRRLGIETVLSQVWWSDRFALALRRHLDFTWVVKLCGCFEQLLATPEMDPTFHERAGAILGEASAVVYGATSNLEVLATAGLPRPRLLRRIFNGFAPASAAAGPAAAIPPRQPGDFVFCICSRAIAEKGWEQAILAVEAINARPEAERAHRRARLWLVGGGPEEERLRLAYDAHPDVHLFGQRCPPHGIMAAADAGLLPSCFRSESVPTAVIEFLGLGRPVVATALGALPEMLEADGVQAGLLVPGAPGVAVDVEALASVMLRYLVDDETYGRHRRGAEIVFASRFAIESTVREYRELLTMARAAALV
jgi:glycosyltransferase involved in cell wall biosynthesis